MPRSRRTTVPSDVAGQAALLPATLQPCNPARSSEFVRSPGPAGSGLRGSKRRSPRDLVSALVPSRFERDEATSMDSPLDDEATFITDDELEALALAADPNPVLTPDARPWAGPDDATPQLLPDWYMPKPFTRSRASWPAVVAAVIIAGFLVIDAFGLCITSGFLSLA